MRQILITENLEQLSSAAADLFFRIANDSLKAHGSFAVALAGGSTPRLLYSRLASPDERKKLDWQRVAFFFGDERHVPPDSDQSNYRMATETLLMPLNVSPTQIHRWRGELTNAQEAAAAYDAELSEFFEDSGRPLDLVLLGLGEDGHTASLFPNTPALREYERLATANWVEKLNAYRLTMTFPTINSSLNVMFVAAGDTKADAARNVLDGEFRPDDLPAQFVNPESGNLFWLLDKGAASLLKER